MKSQLHFLSVIVPVYRQESTIKKDLNTILKTLEQIRYPFELIAVIDGKSVDNSFKIASTIHHPNLKVIGYNQNHGKGYAIRYGAAHTQGDYVAFIDSGMEIDPNGISMLLEHMEWYEADIVVGSKFHPASQISYPLHRRIISFGAHLISLFLLRINLHDTQAGIKIFKQQVLNKILPRLLIKTFAFDLEVLAVSKHLGFTRIYEAPIKLNYDFSGTHLDSSFMKVVLLCLKDSLAVFYRLYIIHYYDDKNRRKWVYDKDLEMRINTGEYE
ncbi:MAG: glycosyltransferase family 2 protein [Candidatus Shapirobacteria bacterium]|jgi:glycosyltransferase involved in cell wall biosynthesis